MIKINAPYKYIQGENLLDELGSFVKEFGTNFLIVAGKSIMRHKKQAIEASFAKEGISCAFEPFLGECSYAEIDRISAAINKHGYGGIIALGGGKVMDTVKGVAFKNGISPIIAPTIASSDAPCSSFSVVYSPEGAVCGIETYPTNPCMVIVDSKVIANAPSDMLIAGMGDALSTYFEARVCKENHVPNTIGSELSLSAYALSKLCYETLLKDGCAAKAAAEQHIVNEALEHIIEANTFLSGIGFESGGLSCAHSI